MDIESSKAADEVDMSFYTCFLEKNEHPDAVYTVFSRVLFAFYPLLDHFWTTLVPPPGRDLLEFYRIK